MPPGQYQIVPFTDDNRDLYYRDDFVAYSILRYEKYWLPFMGKMSKGMEEDLDYCPPLDIHWVWHVHMLGKDSCYELSKYSLTKNRELEKPRI